MKRPVVSLVVGGLLLGSLQAAELKTLDQRYSYTLGVRMARMLKAEGIGKLDGAAFGEAVADVINGNDLQLSEEEMTEVLKQRSERLRRQAARKAEEALERSKTFLAENAKKPDVHVLPSGVQYQVIEEGKGTPPGLEDQVKVHYEGRTIDGRKFDSSRDRGQPAVFALQGVIKGFAEALTRMKPGARWKVFIPPELAYGSRGAGDLIGPNEALVFDLELIEVLPRGD
ncbi:MAG TPA: FKBP-type peptidyl-prolyl cis-trans isomerase [Sedimenticola sp.]|nr:FKBP-type peptidyl-prolyl cis-trans isomerase [Sedimenticola sp.]